MNSRILRVLIVLITVFLPGTSLWAVDCVHDESDFFGRQVFRQAVIKKLSFSVAINRQFNPGNVTVAVYFSNNNPANCQSHGDLSVNEIADEEMTPRVHRGLLYMPELIETLVFVQQKNIPVNLSIIPAPRNAGGSSIIGSVSILSPEGAAPPPPPEQGQQQQGQGGQQGGQQQCPQDRPVYCATDQQCHVTQADCPAQ